MLIVVKFKQKNNNHPNLISLQCVCHVKSEGSEIKNMPCVHKYIYNSTSGDMKTTTVTLADELCNIFIVDLLSMV